MSPEPPPRPPRARSSLVWWTRSSQARLPPRRPARPTPTPGVLARVETQVSARERLRIGAGEPGDHPGDLFGPQRRFLRRTAQRQHGRVDRAGADCVDADPKRAALDGYGLGEAGQARLGGYVGRHSGKLLGTGDA